MSGLMTHDPQNWLWAGGAVAAFIAICLASLWPKKRVTKTATTLVLYASQTGQAEELARSAAKRLDATCLSLRYVTADMLSAAQTILCIASTTGEGDAPDDALAFERGMMRQELDLSGKRFAVLALGDHKYDNFCAFGLRLFDWLVVTQAQALSPCLTADDLDATTLAQWDGLLTQLGASATLDAAVFTPWCLTMRERFNPLGEMPLYRVRLVPANDLPANEMPVWQAGDLAEITTPDGHRRDYSLASLPSEGHAELYVRAVANGTGSGLLTQGLAPGDTVPLRIKSHSGFHAPECAGPVLMIAAGSGLAGLRAHVLAAPKPGWLIYGERHPVRDGALCALARTWPLARLDLAFSQPDTGDKLYVQDIITAQADVLRAYLGEGGVILICGGLAMGQAADAALRAVLGDGWVEVAMRDGRYRRDLY